MRDRFAFWVCFVISFLTACGLAEHCIPGTRRGGPPARPEGRNFLAIYQDVGLDYYAFRFGLFGLGKKIRDADIICSSSSKGLYGFDPELLSQQLSTAERPLKVFNISFGFGEGFGYLAEVIKTLDLRDKVLIADLTDNTCYYHLTPMAQQALQTESCADAYKLVIERMLAFERDRVLQGWIARIRFDSAKGFVVEAQMGKGLLYRSRDTGRIVDNAPARFLAEAGTYSFGFDRDGQLKQRFLDECARRNIQVIFTSIPYQGYDESWGRRVAGELGYPHVTVDPEGIELVDPTHMAPRGRHLFSSRLGARLKETGYCDAALRSASRAPEQRK